MSVRLNLHVITVKGIMCHTFSLSVGEKKNTSGESKLWGWRVNGVEIKSSQRKLSENNEGICIGTYFAYVEPLLRLSLSESTQSTGALQLTSREHRRTLHQVKNKHQLCKCVIKTFIKKNNNNNVADLNSYLWDSELWSFPSWSPCSWRCMCNSLCLLPPASR